MMAAFLYKIKKWKSVSLSLLLHGLMIFLMAQGISTQNTIVKKKNLMEVSLESSSFEAKKEKNIDSKKKKKLKAQEVVQQDILEESKEVPETDLLGEKNQKVKKQTVAKNWGDFKNSALKSNQSYLEEKNKNSPGNKKVKSYEKLFASYDPQEAFQRKINEKFSLNEKGDLGGEKSEDKIKNETQSQTNDYLKGIAFGDETLLNTREFKYHSYYSRIRKQLNQYWVGKIKIKLEKLFKEGRSPANSKDDRITRLLVYLNESGLLVKIQLLEDSGVQDLDDAALEAFREAAPFPNPPKGLFEKDGLVKIRWDFILES